MKNWLLLITSLPTENATARMRAWRSLKASGAAVLRDGVYLLPVCESCQAVFDSVSSDVMANGGSAYLIYGQATGTDRFEDFFDRTEDYAALLENVRKTHCELTSESLVNTTKHARKLRKNFSAIASIDFFPGAAQKQTDAALIELEISINRLLSPEEPQASPGEVQRRSLADYQGRIWATRRRPWVDRLASAWLIRRFIDREAKFLWLDKPDNCPPEAFGFDFDNATFSHVGNKVTYEVIMQSFGLTQLPLQRIGALVHYLDVGGVQPAEAAGVESVLAGLRETISDDDQLLALACGVFDGLQAIYGKTDSK